MSLIEKLRSLPPWANALVTLGPPALYLLLLYTVMPLGLAAGIVGWLLMIAWATILGTIAYKRKDEATRHAHTVAWESGGLLSLLVAMIAALLIGVGEHIHPSLSLPGKWLEDIIASATPPEAPRSKLNPIHGAFILGAIFTAVLQVLGYVVAWLGVWTKWKYGR